MIGVDLQTCQKQENHGIILGLGLNRQALCLR